jgi:N-acetylmuramoyl-L-alanine amidase
LNKRRLLAVLLCLTFILAVFVPISTTAEAAHITKGDTKANIKLVQTRLKELGYYTISVDGIWGSKTLAAVKKFQKDYGLTADGIVGKNTEKALKITLSSSSSSSSSGGGKISSSDLAILARCVHAEARGEPYLGQVAVAAVILNRVKSSSFPNSISGVIYQPGAFTCVADGQINLTAGQSSINASNAALNGDDPTYGCLYYYNPATATSKWIWSLTVTLRIGKHSFAKA